MTPPPTPPHPTPRVRPLGVLVDPIANSQLQIPYVPVDQILDRTSLLDDIRRDLRTVFITTPKTVLKGLRGDRNFNFGDFMLVAKIPYYVGGAVLAGVFAAADPSKVRTLAIGAAVGLYYLGISGANHLINLLYRASYGIDLSLKYRRASGNIEHVFASADFPRTDLLKDAHYKALAKGLNIPEDVADPKKEVNDRLKQIISSSRSLKLILGNVLAAVGAGYLARSDAWAYLKGLPGSLGATLFGQNAGGPLTRVMNALGVIGSTLEVPLRERLQGVRHAATPWLKWLALGGAGMAIGLSLFQAFRGFGALRYQADPTRPIESLPPQPNLGGLV